MESLRQTELKIEQIRGLRDIVHSMRTLASTYLKRAEAQLESVRLYSQTVSTAFSHALAAYGELELEAQHGPAAIALFSTEQGLCGRFNEILFDALKRRIEELGGARVIVVGHRGRGIAEANGIELLGALPSTSSPEGIARTVRSAAEAVFDLYERGEFARLYLLHAVHQAVGRFEERFERVLPLDVERFRAELPRGFVAFSYMGGRQLLGAFVEEFYFVEFHRALVETLAAENSMRLQSMEAAKGNIDETLEDLARLRRILRQDQITEELLDVISGAEALKARSAQRA